MVKETLGQLIEKTRSEYNEKSNVAFLGKVSSGKTVVAALLKHTLSKYWIPNSKWEMVPSSGYDEINEILRNMKKGSFPSATPKENYPKLVLDLYHMEGKPIKFELTLHDMSGENYSNLLTDTSYSNIDERLTDILSGDGVYLAYAKQYIILIDCEEKGEWETDIAGVAPMISTLRAIKQKIHNFDSNELLHTPIAIVFTKSDLLTGEDKNKSPEELAKYYPDLISSLRINHDQKHLGFFRISVSSSKETTHDAEAQIKKNQEEFEIREKERLEIWKTQIGPAIEQAVASAKAKAEEEAEEEEEEIDEEEIQNIIKNKQQQVTIKYKEEFDQKYPQIENQNEEVESSWKVNIPLTYTESEYSKFISWILEIKNDANA